jgi:hypothetical protein
MEIGQLNKRITVLAMRNARVEAEIQTLGIACLGHLAAGNNGPMCKLVLALRRGQHQAFMEWALAFGACVKNADPMLKATKPVVYAKNRITDIEGATAKPWFEFADSKEDAIKKAFDLQGAVMALLKKAAAAGTDHELLVGIATLAGIGAKDVPASVVPAKAEEAIV